MVLPLPAGAGAEQEETMARGLLLLALAGLAAVQEEKIYSNSYKGKAPPALASEKGQWINSDRAIEIDKLKGKVVWLEFSFLG